MPRPGTRRRWCRGRRRRSPRRASRARRTAGSNGSAAFRQLGRGGANARATITFALVNAVLPAREAGRHRQAGRVEEGVLLVDAVVDDADLHALAGGRRGRLPRAAARRSSRGSRWRARGSGRTGRRGRRPAPRRAARPVPSGRRQRARRARPGSASGRSRRAARAVDPRRERALRGRERSHVVARGRRRRSRWPRRVEWRCEPPLLREGARERRLPQRDDDLDRFPASASAGGRRRAHERRRGARGQRDGGDPGRREQSPRCAGR